MIIRNILNYVNNMISEVYFVNLRYKVPLIWPLFYKNMEFCKKQNNYDTLVGLDSSLPLKFWICEKCSKTPIFNGLFWYWDQFMNHSQNLIVPVAAILLHMFFKINNFWL